MYHYGIIENENRATKASKDIVLTWLFEENGTLSIFGSGMLPDYKDREERPWQEFADQVTAVVVDDGITSIGARTFSGYEKLESVKLPDSMNRIGFQAFAGCGALKTVEAGKPFAHVYSTNMASASRGELREDTIYFGMQSFANTPWIRAAFGDFYIHRDVLVEYYGEAEYVEVPKGIREIGVSAFEGSPITAVKLPNTLRIIDSFAFNKTAITTLELPGSVKKVGRFAFAQTAALESVLIGNEQLELEEKAFWHSAVEEAVDPEQNPWISVYHIESIRESGMEPCRRLEVRRDKKKLVGLTTLDCPKAILKKMTTGGPVMRLRVNENTKTVEFVQSFVKDGKNSYAVYRVYPTAVDGELEILSDSTDYLTKADMEELNSDGLWPEAGCGWYWYQAPKGTTSGAGIELTLLRAWLVQHPGYAVAARA